MLTPVILLLATLASVAYFVKIVLTRLAGMSAAKDKNLRFDNVGRRLWTVFAEVMLQTRVIRERPLAGILHALVMWGFFAFAWVSIQHFRHGFAGLEHATPDVSWYGWFAAIWSVAVLVGILGLTYRRFIVRPAALGDHLSVTSGIVAVLIVVLMVTYLGGWGWLEIPSLAWKANWWAHSAALLGMLWVIPRSKHLHLVIGPAAVFFRGDVTSNVRALREDDDDDFGMLAFTDLSQKDILDVNSCVECGRCSDNCPANIIGGTLDPKQVILQMQSGLLAGGSAIAGTVAEVEAGEAWVSELDLFQCLSCGACEQACPVGIEHVGMKILELRRGLVSEGRTNSDKLTDMFTTMERSPHNAWGVSQEVRQKFVESEELPIFDGSQEWLLWLGCGCSYDPHGQDVARSMKQILNASGVSWGVLKRETCCGEPARRAGNEYLYMELSQKVIEAFESGTVKKIVTSDPHCTRMFDVDYRQEESFTELDIEVIHHTELLDRLMPKLDLTPSLESVTMHDPCYLARGRGVTEQPRNVMQAIGANVIEMEHHGKETFCCGAGGAQLFIADDKEEFPGGRVNHKRFAEVEATGVDTVVVACPYCPIMLKDAANQANREDVKIVDVAELVAARLN